MSQQPPLQHIKWRRINLSEQRKTKPNPGIRFPPRLQPQAHGQTLNNQNDFALNQIQQARNQAGIDPTKLLALDFKFLEAGQRDHLNRLGIEVLDEKEQRVALPSPIFNVSVKFERPEHLLNFVETQIPNTANVEYIRASTGDLHDKRINLSFNSRDEAKSFIQAPPSVDGIEVAPQPQRKNHETVIRLLGQFPDLETIVKFKSELARYQNGAGATSGEPLTLIQRRELFDSLESVSNLSPEEKIGTRLTEEGLINTGVEAYFDVDLWHPGQLLLNDAISQFSTLVTGHGGTITDRPTSVANNSMLLARVRGNRQLLDALILYDRVALIDLPSKQNPFELTIFDHVDTPTLNTTIDPDGPLACLIDSGVVSGHPLLRNTILDARDFGSGENTPFDLVGHGTHCAGVIVYGDVNKCLQENSWVPKVRLLSAKVLKKSALGGAEFPDETRIETQVRNAITTFAQEYGCRVFNLSIGHSGRKFTGGRQLPLAQLIDELARTLNVVCIVSAGNVDTPEIPTALVSEDFQLAVRNNLLTQAHALIDPATSMLALTVGSVAKDDSFLNRNQAGPGRRSLAGSPKGGPSPFTRTGQYSSEGSAPNRAVKPELIAPGGNYILDVPTRWNRTDTQIGIPSLNYNFTQRTLSTAVGTSVAAPYVTHCCAIIESALRKQGLPRPSANLIRALTVHGASVPNTTREWIQKNIEGEAQQNENTIRMVGYGLPALEKSIFSSDNRVTLYSEDNILDNNIHLYELEIPNNFVGESGQRTLKVTLAYDPPVRGTRKEYLGRTMWFQVCRGISRDQIVASMSSRLRAGDRPTLADRYILKCNPSHSNLEWSTVQSAQFSTTRATAFNDYRLQENGPAIFHILVGSKFKFACDLSVNQNYSLIATLEHSNDNVRMHQTIRAKVEQRNRIHFPG